MPHGATRRAELDELAALLRGPLPPGLDAFFHVNTDEGAPEVALATATRLAADGVAGVVLRCRLARTLVDANRVLGDAPEGMTAGLPAYVAEARDRRRLAELHAEYTALAGSAYAEVCGAGGLAVAVHTFAPKSVDVEVGADVVAALRRAYRPALYGRWELRPPVEGITADAAGRRLAPEALVAALARRYPAIGLPWRENRTYHLHAATMGHRHAVRWPGRVLTVELRRDLLGAPWRPFVESSIGPRKAARLAAPLAAAIAEAARTLR